MRKIIKRITLGLVVAVAILALTQVKVLAETPTEQSSESVDIVNKTLFLDGRSTDKKIVHGDVFCFDRVCEINGVVKGDVIAMAYTVNIKAIVHGNVRAAGAKITIADGTAIDRNATLTADEIRIDKEATIGQDLILAMRDLQFHGRVGRDGKLIGENIYLAGEFSRDVEISSDRTTVISDAKIDGNLTVRSAEATVDKSVVAGKYDYQQTKSMNGNRSGLILSAAKWWMMINVIVLGLILIIARPKKLHSFAQREFNLANIFLVVVGFGAVIGLPMIAAMLVLTGVGALIGLLVLVLWGMMLILSVPCAWHYIVENSAATLKTKKRWPAVVIAVVAYAALSLSPISWLINITLGLFGAGLIVRSVFAGRGKKQEASVND